MWFTRQQCNFETNFTVRVHYNYNTVNKAKQQKIRRYCHDADFAEWKFLNSLIDVFGGDGGMAGRGCDELHGLSIFIGGFNPEAFIVTLCQACIIVQC